MTAYPWAFKCRHGRCGPASQWQKLDLCEFVACLSFRRNGLLQMRTLKICSFDQSARCPERGMSNAGQRRIPLLQTRQIHPLSCSKTFLPRPRLLLSCGFRGSLCLIKLCERLVNNKRMVKLCLLSGPQHSVCARVSAYVVFQQLLLVVSNSNWLPIKTRSRLAEMNRNLAGPRHNLALHRLYIAPCCPSVLCRKLWLSFWRKLSGDRFVW